MRSTQQRAPVKKAPAPALHAAAPIKKAPAKPTAPKPGAKPVKPEEVIPLDEHEFKDF